MQRMKASNISSSHSQHLKNFPQLSPFIIKFNTGNYKTMPLINTVYASDKKDLTSTAYNPEQSLCVSDIPQSIQIS
jgi:hypothetical protein